MFIACAQSNAEWWGGVRDTRGDGRLSLKTLESNLEDTACTGEMAVEQLGTQSPSLRDSIYSSKSVTLYYVVTSLASFYSSVWHQPQEVPWTWAWSHPPSRMDAPSASSHALSVSFCWDLSTLHACFSPCTFYTVVNVYLSLPLGCKLFKEGVITCTF